MSDTTITYLVLGVVVAVFVWDHLPVAAVALGTALTLWATGVLTLDQSLAGFGDPTVIFIASLFVVSEALDATGITAWPGQALIDRAGDSRARVLVFTLLLVATPANLMVMEPGGYRFGDYWKLGLPLLVLYGLVAVLLVPVFWRF